MSSGLSKDFEIPFGEAKQPVVNAGFHRWETGHAGIFDDLIGSDHTHGPAGKAPGEAAVVVDPLGDEFLLAAENAVSFLLVDDAEPLVEPPLTGKNVNKLPQEILRPLTGGIPHGPVFRFHFVPISGLHQMPKLRPLHLEAFAELPSHFYQKYRRSLPAVKKFQELAPLYFIENILKSIACRACLARPGGNAVVLGMMRR
jgi:hypothetical protein